MRMTFASFSGKAEQKEDTTEVRSSGLVVKT